MRKFFKFKSKTFQGIFFVLFLVTILALGFYFPNLSLQAASRSGTWTTKEDFESNASTTGTPTTRTNIDTTSSPGDIKVGSTLFDTGTGAEGDLIVNGTTVILDGRHNFNNVTIINGGVLTHSTAAGAGTGIEGLELYVTGTLYIDATSRIDVAGKGYGASQGPGAGWDDFGGGAGGGAYGGTGGDGGYAAGYGGTFYGAPTGVEYMGSGGGNTTSTSGIEGYGGAGGGRVKVVANTVNIEGSIQANGMDGSGNREGGGGGSGGGIYLAAHTVNVLGYLSAAGGGGGGTGNGTAGFNGTGGNGGGGGLGGPPGLGGNGGDYGQNGGFSAGGGGLQNSYGAGGGGAGRIAIYYGTFNGGLVAPSWDVNQSPTFGLPGEDGFADAPGASNKIGPYAYFSPLTTLTSGIIGGAPYGKKGLRVDAGAKANWKRLDWTAEPLTGSQNIELQIRVANSLEELDSAVYVGWDGTSHSWFDESHKDIPSSVLETRYAEIQVRLTSVSSSPVLHDVTLIYDVVNLPSPSDLSQYKSDGVTPIPVGEGTNESSVVLKTQNIQGMENSTNLFAEFEVKPVNQAFDGQNIVAGNSSSSGGESLANVPLPPAYLGNVARGKPYTYYPYLPRPEYPDANQAEFTDGDPSTTFGYSGWSNVDIFWDITVDLSQVYNIYQATLHSGGGLKANTADSVEILTSVDNINFTSKGVNSSGSFQMTLNFPLTQARYVKFHTVKKVPPQGDFFKLFLGEGEVFAYASTLPPEQGYHWRVRIKDAQGRASAWSYFGNNSDGNPAAGINAQTDFWVDTVAPSIPGVPTTVSPTTDITPTWTWDSSTDTGSGLKGYHIFVGTSPGASDIIAGDFTPTNSYTHPSPLSLGTYYAYVEAIDKADNLSGPSGNGTVEIASVVDPSFLAPTSLNVTLEGTDVNLTWAAPAVSDVDHYNIYRAYQRITNANKSQAKLLATTSTLNYIDLTGLAGKTYYYQVTSVNTLGEESGVSTVVINDSVTIPGGERATWTTREDFESNASTIPGTTTTRTGIDTSSFPGDVKLQAILNTGTGAEGDLVIDGTNPANSTDGIKHDASNPLVINGIHNYRNVTLQNGAVVTHSPASGGMELYVSGNFAIDSSSKIEVSGKGYGPQSGPGSGTGCSGAGYGGRGGGNEGRCLGSAGVSYGQFDGSDGMQMGSGAQRTGGGRVKIIANVVNIEGQIQANGLGGGPKGSAGGGGAAGGGILIMAPNANVSGILSAAGGGGGGAEPTGGSIDRYGEDGFSGKGGDGANYSNGGLPGVPPGDGGKGQWITVGSGGPSAGGGGWGFSSISWSDGGGGGGAGRIAIHYGNFNGGLVAPVYPSLGLPGELGYGNPSETNLKIGPFAYYSQLSYQTLGAIGGTGPGDVGLRVDSGSKAKWLSLDWDVEPLLANQNIEFQIRVADTEGSLDSATYVGPDGTSNTWFNGANKNIPVSIGETRYAELRLKLASDGTNTPILHDVTLNYDAINALPPAELAQYKADGLTPLAVGGATNESSVVLEAQGVTGLADSTNLQAQFEIKSVAQVFDEIGLTDGNITNVGESSRATLTSLSEGAYHWRARILDAQGRFSPWTFFGGNSDGSPPTTPADSDFYIDLTPPSKPGTPTADSPTDDTTPTWSWAASSDNLSGLKGYHISVGTTPGGADIVGDAFVAENSFTQPTPLEPGTYYATVSAEDKAGNLSEVSDSGTVVIAFTVPANLNVEAEPAPSKKINLTWTGPEIGVVDHYNVYRSTEGSITNENLSQAERIADDVSGASYTDGTGYPGETYYYQVTAVDNSGVESEVSLFVINDQATVAGENPHGDYSNITGKCRDCHKIHLAKGTKKIFRKSPNIEVCYTCHDGSGSTFNIRITFENLAAHEQHLAAPPDTEIVCTNCHHPHAATNFLGVGGGERMTKKVEENLCFECHNQPISANSWNIKEQFEKASRHAITGITADGLQGAKVECSSCHGPHTVQRGQGLSDPNKRLADPFNTSNLWSGTFTDFCLNCHRSGDLPQKTATTEVFVPYTIQFPEVKQFLFFQGWDKIPFKTSEHNAKGITCQKCHQPHGSENPRLNAFFDESLGYDIGENANEEKLCFKCHNPDKVGGAPDIKTPFEKAGAHPILRRAKHKDTEGPMDLGELNRHVECQDCHDPHRAKAGLHTQGTNFAGNILTGMKGVGVINGIPGISPTLYYPADPIIYEYQLCFKCHSSYTYLPTNVPERTELNSEQPIPPKDKAVEFNPNNPSYHPVEGIGKNLGLKDKAFTLGTPWNPTPLDDPDYGLTGNVEDPNSKVDPNYPGKITCTDCHGNDDESGAQGPHGSANLRILKKPFTYKEEFCGQFCHPGRKQLTGEKELCFKCHNPAVYRDGAPGSRFSEHEVHVSGAKMSGMRLSCYQCHDIHGSSGRPHLIRLSASYENNKITGFSHSSTQSYCDAAHHQGGAETITHGGNPLYPENPYIHQYPHISGEVPLPNRFEESADGLDFTGIWWLVNDTNASGGRYLSAPNAPWNDGATVTLTFTGAKVSLISKKGLNGGYAKVYIDGVLQGEVDLCSSQEQWQKAVFTKEGLTPGAHTVTIELKYRAQNNCATTLSQNQEVTLDAFALE